MTGFFISVAGLSLINESFNARRTISGSNNGRARTRVAGSKEAGAEEISLEGASVTVGMC
jgi:hypothetical protein